MEPLLDGLIHTYTDEQIDKAIAYIEEQLAKRDGSSAKVINAEPLDVVSDSDNRNSD